MVFADNAFHLTDGLAVACPQVDVRGWASVQAREIEDGCL